jgi:drug/metabolite transporter (DMT)-like permease
VNFTGVPATRSAFQALSPHQQGLVAVLAAAVLWSTGGLFIKWVSLDALGVTMWRSLLAGAVIWVVARPPLRLPWHTSRLTWGIAITYALTLVMFVGATKLTTSANAIFLQYTAPLYLLVSGALFLGPCDRGGGFRRHGALLRREVGDGRAERQPAGGR